MNNVSCRNHILYGVVLVLMSSRAGHLQILQIPIYI
jgi:hypothetical protein